MSKDNAYTMLEESILHENPYWTYVKDEYVLSDGKSISSYFHVRSHGSTLVIPMVDDHTMIMVKQFRYLNQRMSLEFPGGGIAFGLSPLENAHKELTEETGFIAKDMQCIGTFNPCNGMTNELCSVYIAKGLVLSSQDMDPTEDIELINISIQECQQLINNGEVWDGMTLACWTLFQTVHSKDISR